LLIIRFYNNLYLGIWDINRIDKEYTDIENGQKAKPICVCWYGGV